MKTPTSTNAALPWCSWLKLALFGACLSVSPVVYSQLSNCYNVPPMPQGYNPLIRESFLIVPKLNSYIVGGPTIYLDFDGDTTLNLNWSTEPIISLPADVTEAKIIEVQRLVADDYRFTNINVTTDLASFLAATPGRRQRVVITPSSSWRPISNGGIAYNSSFIWGDDTPCFVFSDRMYNMPKYIAECTSHESGHTLGCNHETVWTPNCQLVSAYNGGQGSGETSWAPIMGSSYGRNQTLWSNGPAYSCSTFNASIQTITRLENNVQFRPRTGGQSITLSPGETVLSLTIQPHLIDSIRLQQANNMAVRVIATSMGNVDTKVRLNGVESNPLDSLSSSLFTVLNAPNEWLEIMGVDNINSPDYGNTGGVTLKIQVTPIVVLAEPKAQLSVQGNILVWNAEGSLVELEMSTGNNVFVPFATNLMLQGTKSYTSQQLTYFRLKVTNSSGEVAYSRVVTMAGNSQTWELLDLNYRLIRKGKGPVDKSGLAAAIYIVHYPQLHVYQKLHL